MIDDWWLMMDGRRTVFWTFASTSVTNFFFPYLLHLLFSTHSHSQSRSRTQSQSFFFTTSSGIIIIENLQEISKVRREKEDKKKHGWMMGPTHVQNTHLFYSLSPAATKCLCGRITRMFRSSVDQRKFTGSFSPQSMTWQLIVLSM